jgi:uncharacterized protein (DUF2147 family)
MKRYLIIGILILFSVNIPAQAGGQDITGVWLTEKGVARIEIYQTSDSLYEGKIVWSADQSAKAKSNWGIVVVKKFKKTGKKNYKGYVYDPERKETYSATITLKSKDELDLRGYIGISLLGMTEHWKRYVEPNNPKK